MMTRYSAIWGLILLGTLLLACLVPNCNYAPRTYPFFIFRICMIFTPSLALRKVLAILVVLPVTILMTAVSLIQIGSEVDSHWGFCILILALDLVINVVLISITHFESVDSRFGRYLFTLLICHRCNHRCSICLHQIDGCNSGVSLACGHCYHKECIDEWFTTQLRSCIADQRDHRLTCPVCRFDPMMLENRIFNATEGKID